MSNAEIAPESSPYFSYEMPPLVNGSCVNPGVIPNYYPGISQIVGLTLVTAGAGIPGEVFIVKGGVLSALPATNGYATITISETGPPGLNVSTYRIVWTNRVAQSQLTTVYEC